MKYELSRRKGKRTRCGLQNILLEGYRDCPYIYLTLWFGLQFHLVGVGSLSCCELDPDSCHDVSWIRIPVMV